MSIYHLAVQVISRSAGRSATAAASYRAGIVIVDTRTGEVHDNTRKRGVLHCEILAPVGAAAWVFDRSELWNRVEQSEKRKDAQVSRELNIALPHELTSEQRLDLIRRYVTKNFVSQGMVADVCLHAPGRGDDAKNHHAHVMLTTRTLDGDGFGPKAREWNSVAMLESWRKSWADMANEALAEAGHDARIDHRSHEARGLTEVPGQHYGPAVSGLLGRGEPSDVAERMDAERATRERAQREAQLAIARAQAAAAQSELRALEAAELAQEALDVARLAQAQEKERERAQRLLIAAQDRESAHAKRMQSERVALEQARSAYKSAEQVLKQAELAEQEASLCVEQLKNDRDWAILGQQEAGQSMLKTAQALLKLPGWTRAINAYETAVQVLSAAVRAVNAARQKVAQAWQKVLGLDPIERAKLAEKVAAIAEKTEKVPVHVQKQDLNLVVVSKVHQTQELNPDFEDFGGQKSDELDAKPQ